MESSETSKASIRREKVSVDRYTQVGSEKESCLWGSLNHLYQADLPSFPWPIILLYLTLSPHLVWFSTANHVHAHVLARMDSRARVSGKLTEHVMVWSPLPSLTSEESFCARVVWESSLTSRMRNLWCLCLSSEQDSAPPHSCHHLHHEASVHRGQVPAAQPEPRLSPASSEAGRSLLCWATHADFGSHGNATWASSSHEK